MKRLGSSWLLYILLFLDLKLKSWHLVVIRIILFISSVNLGTFNFWLVLILGGSAYCKNMQFFSHVLAILTKNTANFHPMCYFKVPFSLSAFTSPPNWSTLLTVIIPIVLSRVLIKSKKSWWCLGLYILEWINALEIPTLKCDTPQSDNLSLLQVKL